MKTPKIELTFARAEAIIESAVIIWSEVEDHARDPAWQDLIAEVKQRFPNLARRYPFL